MESFADEPTLTRVLRDELAEGNTVAESTRDVCGREELRLEAPFRQEWWRILNVAGVSWYEHVASVQVDHGEFATIARDCLVAEGGSLVAPLPTPEERAARLARLPKKQRDRVLLAEGPLPRSKMLLRCAREIESDLRRAGVWQEGVTTPPPFRAAFGADVMPFTDWLQLVYLPRLREIAERNLPLPGPGVAAYAVRELDGTTSLDGLLNRLSWIDSLATPPREVNSRRPVDARACAVWFGFAALLLVLAGVAVSLGLALAEQVGGTRWFLGHGAMVGLQVSNLRSAPNSQLELRVESRGPTADRCVVTRVELVTMRTAVFRGIEPGLVPLGFDVSSPPPASRIADWFIQRDADRSLAGNDAATLIQFASSLIGLPGELKGVTVPPPWREIGERARYPYEIGMGESWRIAIVGFVLLLVLIPATWWGVVTGRRILARGRN